MHATEGNAGPELPDEWDDEELDAGLEGEVLAGRYRLERKLGQGGMATVYVGEHVELGRRVAVKVLAPAYASDPEAVERFLREARAASKIRHPGVIEITDFGRTGTTVFFVMELLAGEDLLTRIERRKRLPWAEGREILLQICDALATAHALGIVHRDLKPENCFCTDVEGGGVRVKVLDFGIAKVDAGSWGGQALTQFGRVFGTPAYMSPEQAEGKPADARSDVYSLGLTAFHTLTGELPFQSDTAMGFLKHQMFSLPRSPRAVAPDAAIPPEVEAIVLKCLQKDPALRFQTMAELRAAILAVGTGRAKVKVVAEQLPEAPSFVGRAIGFEGTPRSRGKWLLAGVGALAAVIVAVLLARPAAEPVPEPTPEVAAAPVEVKPAEPEPVQPAAPTSVTLRIDSNVDARVIDRASAATLGRTGDPGGIVLPRSDTPRELVLSAEGYEDAPLRVTPARDLQLSAVLKRKKKQRVTKTKSGGPSLEPVNPFKKGSPQPR